MSALDKPMADWTPEEEEAMRRIGTVMLTYGEQERQEAQYVLDQLDKIQTARDKQIGGDHYKDMGVEPWDVVDTWPLEQRIGAYRHGALKYLMRMGSKDEQLQEIKNVVTTLRNLLKYWGVRDGLDRTGL